MKTSKLLLLGVMCVAIALAFPMAMPAMAAAPTFTGDVEADFTGLDILTFVDTGGQEIVVPGHAIPGTSSGWDIKDIRLAYDPPSDTLYVGINSYETVGDADSDGDEGGMTYTSGTDVPNLGVNESVSVYFNLDQIGDYDVIAGVPGNADFSGFTVASYIGIPTIFGATLGAHVGSVYWNPGTDPDFEFTILNFSTLPGQDGALGAFDIVAFMGSLIDGNIGEDFITYEQSPTTITIITASAANVTSGGSVDLTVTEENDGDVPLTSPQVVVTKDGSPLATLVGPPDSGDNANGILDPLEIWSWTISSGHITVDPTAFVATGSGIDPLGNVVTYPGDPEEQDEVTVEIGGGGPGQTLAEKAVELAKEVIGKGYGYKDCGVWKKMKGYTFYWINEEEKIVTFLPSEQIESLDCSGLFFWSYNSAHYGHEPVSVCKDWPEKGVNNPVKWFGADMQYRANTDPISKAQLMPGDLVFFNVTYKYKIEDGYKSDWRTPDIEDDVIDHVALYIGSYGGESHAVIHAHGGPDNTGNAGKISVTSVDGLISYYSDPSRTGRPESEIAFFRRLRDNGAVDLARMRTWIASPVDLLLTDPDGETITKELGETKTMEYKSYDFDGDGEPDDIITSPEIKMGDYLIQIIPEPGALTDSTYSLYAMFDGETLTLASDIRVSDIPPQPYIIRSTGDEIIPIIPSTVNFDPDTLNPLSPGLWVTVYIELPSGHGYETEQINITSLILNGQVFAETHPTEIGDYDEDGIPDLMVKFNRQQVADMLEPGVQMIQLTGQLSDGTLFAGNDTIRVLTRKSGETAEQEINSAMPDEFLTDSNEDQQIIDDEEVYESDYESVDDEKQDVKETEEEPDITSDDSGDKVTDDAVDTEEAIISKISEAAEIINELVPGSFNNEESFITFTNQMDDVLSMLDEGLYTEALTVIENDILERTNGCAETGQLDENDWIMDCKLQVLVYPLLLEAIELLESLI